MGGRGYAQQREPQSNDRHRDLFRFVFSGHLLNQSNNGSPEFGVFDLLVGFRERKPLRRGEEAGDIVARLVQDRRRPGCIFKEEGEEILILEIGVGGGDRLNRLAFRQFSKGGAVDSSWVGGRWGV